MPRKIEWHLNVGVVGGDRGGVEEFPDDATEEQIDEAISTLVHNIISWSWWDADNKGKADDR